MGLKLLEENFASTSTNTVATVPVSSTTTDTAHTTYTAAAVTLVTVPVTSTTNTTAATAATVGIVDTTAILELIRDMRDSSVIAVNTLNDLLLYEKIESNMLTIELTKVKLFDVVADVIKMFKIQVCIYYTLLYTCTHVSMRTHVWTHILAYTIPTMT